MFVNVRYRLAAVLSALAIMMTSSVSGTAAPSPDVGTAIMNPKPSATRTIQAGEPVTLSRGESVRVMLPKAKPFVAQAPARNDEKRLADWLNGRKGLTFAEVQAFIAAEQLTIPNDALASIKNALGEAGVKPGPSSNPDIGINRLNFLYSYYVVDDWHTNNIGECGFSMGTVGSGYNGSRYSNDVTVDVTRTISNSATVKTGTTLAAISAEVGFDVTDSTSITTSITVSDVPPGGSVRIVGWKMGDCVQYMYARLKYNVYYNTVTWQTETHFASETWYGGVAFDAQWIHLESQ